MSRFLCILILASTAVGCRPGAAQEFVFRCPGGAELGARYVADSVRLRLPDGEATLPVARSGSGARYANDTLVFWEHGGAVRVERRGVAVYDGCRPAQGGRPQDVRAP